MSLSASSTPNQVLPQQASRAEATAAKPSASSTQLANSSFFDIDAHAEPELDAGAALVAALLAVDPQGLGGIRLQGPATAQRGAWLKHLRALLPEGTPWERLPVQASDTALLGGLDLAATLGSGRAVAQPGLLARADGGVVVLGMAERVPAGMAAHLAAVLDQGEINLAREGLSERRAARLALVALDEGQADEEQLPPALCDRLAFSLDLAWRPVESKLDKSSSESSQAPTWQRSDIEAARARLARVNDGSQTVETLCATALVLGVDSLRSPLLALRVARAAAALTGEMQVDDGHIALAARLVLAPRATRLPPAAEEPGHPTDCDEANDKTPEPPQAQTERPDQPQDTEASESNDKVTDEEVDEEAPSSEDIQQALQEMVVEAALAAIPPGLLAALKAGEAKAQAARGGRAGAAEKNQRRGRPVGTRRGEPRAGARLHVLDTLRAAAPWQKLRRSALLASEAGTVDDADSAAARSKVHKKAERPRILVRREDFHVMRFKQNRPTTTLFVVDASGSSALHRLAEAKGAVELLLADCYVRRDRVAVISFGGSTAQMLLPPTRSLARAKRSLAALPGGGGTPLASGMDAARELAVQIARQGETPVVVLLTDGRANMARDGTPGRSQAGQDALHAAREFSLAGVSALLIDTSPQPQAQAQQLAKAMGATYLPLPFAGAQGLNQAVRLAGGVSSARRAPAR